MPFAPKASCRGMLLTFASVALIRMPAETDVAPAGSRYRFEAQKHPWACHVLAYRLPAASVRRAIGTFGELLTADRVAPVAIGAAYLSSWYDWSSPTKRFPDGSSASCVGLPSPPATVTVGLGLPLIGAVYFHTFAL